MFDKIEQSKENKSKPVSNFATQSQDKIKQGLSFVDNRPEVIIQRKIQKTANNSQVTQATQLHSAPSGAVQRVGLLGLGAGAAVGGYALYKLLQHMFPAVTLRFPDSNMDIWEGWRDFSEATSVRSKLGAMSYSWLSLEVNLGGNDLGLTEMFIKPIIGGGWVDVDSLTAGQLGAYSNFSRFKIVIHIGPELLADDSDTNQARITTTLHHEWSSHALPFYNFAKKFGRTRLASDRAQLANTEIGAGGSLDVDEQHDQLSYGTAEGYREGMNQSADLIRRRNQNQADIMEIDGLTDQIDHFTL